MEPSLLNPDPDISPSRPPDGKPARAMNSELHERIVARARSNPRAVPFCRRRPTLLVKQGGRLIGAALVEPQEPKLRRTNCRRVHGRTRAAGPRHACGGAGARGDGGRGCRQTRGMPMRLTGLALGAVLAGPAAAADCDHAASQFALNRCADAALASAGMALDAAYQQIIRRLEGAPDTAGRLRTAQRAWLEFRDQECAFAGSAAAQGSIHPLLVATCRTDLTRQRTERGRYLRCAEGDLGCPVPGPRP